jgi:glycerol-3-phosphate acyltransferase PlsY
MIELGAGILGYLIGSIPFGLLLPRLFGFGDIRKIGSGNIGATNVLRTGNKFLALSVLILDSGKGAIAVLLAHAIGDFSSALVAGLFSIIGHMFPVWLKFRGGKGVATTLGMLIALAPTVGIGVCLIWLITASVFKYSSLAALVCIFFSPVLAHFIYTDEALTGVCSLIVLLVWIKHRENLKRLVNGEEPKIGKSKKVDEP